MFFKRFRGIYVINLHTRIIYIYILRTTHLATLYLIQIFGVIASLLQTRFISHRHPLPDSPPDSSSEHPYSPQENCENNLNATENIYSSLGQQIYKPTLLNPIITDNLIIGSHIVVSEPSTDSHLLENGTILQDNRLLDNENLRTGTNGLLNGRLLQENDTNLLNERMIISEGNIDSNQQNFVDNCQRNDNLLRRNTSNDLVLIKSSGESPLVHLGFNANVDMSQIPQQNCEAPPMENIVYTNLQNVSKKRKLSQDVPLVKSEPGIRDFYSQ